MVDIQISFKGVSRIHTIKMRAVPESDEKLRTISVWSFVGHAKKGR